MNPDQIKADREHMQEVLKSVTPRGWRACINAARYWIESEDGTRLATFADPDDCFLAAHAPTLARAVLSLLDALEQAQEREARLVAAAEPIEASDDTFSHYRVSAELIHALATADRTDRFTSEMIVHSSLEEAQTAVRERREGGETK